MRKNFMTQNVNSWLCMALLALMCFWTVLYYVTHKALGAVDAFAASPQAQTSNY